MIDIKTVIFCFVLYQAHSRVGRRNLESRFKTHRSHKDTSVPHLFIFNTLKCYLTLRKEKYQFKKRIKLQILSFSLLLNFYISCCRFCFFFYMYLYNIYVTRKARRKNQSQVTLHFPLKVFLMSF